jgi:hypothetical protein
MTKKIKILGFLLLLSHVTMFSQFNVYFAVKHHIVRSTNGTNGASLEKIAKGMEILNKRFASANIQFYSCSSIDYVNNDAYITCNPTVEQTLIQNNNVANMINIYYFKSSSTNSDISGYAYFPSQNKNFIAINNDYINTSVIAHEMGHFFDLLHTFETSLGNELANQTNCTIAGDLLCDTKASPFFKTSYNIQPGTEQMSCPAGSSGFVCFRPIIVCGDNTPNAFKNYNPCTCTYFGNEKDANNQPYTPNGRNLMSSATILPPDHNGNIGFLGVDCATDPFTPQQITRIQAAANMPVRTVLRTGMYILGLGSTTSITSNTTYTKDVIVVNNASVGNGAKLTLDDCANTVIYNLTIGATSSLEIK